MNKETSTLTKLAIALAAILVMFAFAAGTAAGTAFLLTREHRQSEASLANFIKPRPEASIFTASSGFSQASMVVTEDGESHSRFSLSGELQEMNEDTMVVAGQTVQRANVKLDVERIQVGSYVVVQGTVNADGTLVADAVYPTDGLENSNACVITGKVESLDGDKLVVEGKPITLVDGTVVSDDIGTEDRVVVEGILLEEGEIVATDVKLLGDGDERRFEFSGKVESIDPWIVAGVEVAQDSSTQVDAAIQVGSPVVVRGVILGDGTWLARQISFVSTNSDEIVVVFLGTVENTNPWIVNGVTLSISEAAVIEDGIAAGTLVRVEAVLKPDGTYVIRSIRHIDQGLQDGCFRINDVVVSLDGNRLRLQKWPDLVLADDVTITGDLLRPGSLVLVTLCVTDEQVLVVRFIEVFDRDEDEDGDWQGENQVTICHIPPGNPGNRHTITIGESAVEAHVRNHGDTLGACP